MVPPDILLKILSGKVTKYFKPINKDVKKPLERCGERPLTTGRKSKRVYANIDILHNKRKTIPELTNEDLQSAGFTSLNDFIKRWVSDGNNLTDQIDVVTFEVLFLRKYGKEFLISHNIKVPKFNRW